MDNLTSSFFTVPICSYPLKLFIPSSVLWLVLSLTLVPLIGETTPPLRDPETPEQHVQRMAWWREAKFGMFIHWGIYSIPADGEWYMRHHKMSIAEYSKFAAEFNPVKFNADEWAGLAEQAGMKYMVITSKHHDGFAMFHSAASSYNIYDATPFKRDPLKELSEACPKHGVKFGVYYSAMADWGHPGGGAGCPKWDPAQEGDLDEYVNKIAVPQVKELLTNYGPLGVMWFDSDGSAWPTGDQLQRFAAVLRLQPNLIVNPRLVRFPGDFETSEGGVPRFPPAGKDWETCETMNGIWGYTSGKAKSRSYLLDQLCDAWGKGGNFLLNVGPNREGLIPADQAVVLREIGAWMKTNGEAIYGSKAGPFAYLPWGCSTRKGNNLYLLVHHWPKDGKLRVPMDNAVSNPVLLADPRQKISVHLQGDVTVLDVPSQAPDPDFNVIRLEVQGEIKPNTSLLLNCPVTASDNQPKAKGLVDGKGGGWSTTQTEATLQFDIGQPKTFAILRILLNRSSITRVLCEVQKDKQWITCCEEIKPQGSELVTTFPPTTAQVIRLTITTEKPDLGLLSVELYPEL